MTLVPSNYPNDMDYPNDAHYQFKTPPLNPGCAAHILH